MYQHQLGYRAASKVITSGGYLPALLTELSNYAEATVELFAGAASCVLATFVCPQPRCKPSPAALCRPYSMTVTTILSAPPRPTCRDALVEANNTMVSMK
jgi:hypothetical protein